MEINNNIEDIASNDMEAFRHDFINIFTTIGGFIEAHDLNGLENYYKDFMKDFKKVNEFSKFNSNLINNPGIYNLLVTKNNKAVDNNIVLNLEFFFDLNKLKMPIYDLSRILGILIDNAIEAACDSEERKVNIMFRDSTNLHTQIIKISNSCNSSKEINLSKIFEKGISQKQGHSGIGLWEVKKIVDRNRNTKLGTKIYKNYFEQTIEISY